MNSAKRLTDYQKTRPTREEQRTAPAMDIFSTLLMFDPQRLEEPIAK